MTVSVVIPAYNEEKYLPSVLKSILKQKHRADEILVVDNNSKDRTAQIAREMGATVVREPKQGMIPARNRAFNTAQSDLIARLDADTIIPPTYLEKMVEVFEDPNVVGASALIMYPNTSSKAPALVKSYVQFVKLLIGHEVLLGPNMVIRKSAWEKVKKQVCTNDKIVHEDIDLSIHLSKVGEIELVKNVIVRSSSRRMRHNPESFFVEYPIRLAKTLVKHKKVLTNYHTRMFQLEDNKTPERIEF